MGTEITLMVGTEEVVATADHVTHRVPTTLRFVEVPRSGWLLPRPAHVRAILPGDLPPAGLASEEVTLFPATADGRDKGRHLAATFDALALRFLEGRFLKVKPKFVVMIAPSLQQRLGGHGRAIMTAALAPISLGTTFADP